MEHDTTLHVTADDIQSSNHKMALIEAVDAKIDTMNALMVDIRDAMVASHSRMTKHELLLDEIRVNADFRRRESENSVREIKTQMVGMEHEIDSKTSVIVDKIFEKLDSVEKAQQTEISKLVKNFNSDVDLLKKRVGNIEQWNVFQIIVLIIVAALVLLFP